MARCATVDTKRQQSRRRSGEGAGRVASFGGGWRVEEVGGAVWVGWVRRVGRVEWVRWVRTHPPAKLHAQLLTLRSEGRDDFPGVIHRFAVVVGGCVAGREELVAAGGPPPLWEGGVCPGSGGNTGAPCHPPPSTQRPTTHHPHPTPQPHPPPPHRPPHRLPPHRLPRSPRLRPARPHVGPRRPVGPARRPGPRRPAALRERIGGISAKVLTESVRRLCAYAFIGRRTYAEAPPRVDHRPHLSRPLPPRSPRRPRRPRCPDLRARRRGDGRRRDNGG
ncbi:winged helix-turn-helix transcriptional regulator [Streptomyces sp. P6-2-1]|uniref:winged helix-turn-helix transcriptional regulator n=1 Tax=Streptomyces sp. P6-2-1 TaxID=3422591 RepID=UPI003D35DE89